MKGALSVGHTTTLEMAVNNNTPPTTTSYSQVCFHVIPDSIGITLAVLATPIHIFVIRALIINLQLRNPRHMIILNLSASDIVQILGRATAVLLTLAHKFTINKTGCILSNFMIKFTNILSVVSSSGLIIALSLERYIACVHCLRVHSIVTNRRVKVAMISIWATALFCAVGVVTADNYKGDLDSDWYSGVYIVVTSVCLLIITYVQITLYKLSKNKIHVLPSQFGIQAETYYDWKRNIKITCATAAVSVLHIICLFPKSVFFVYSKVCNCSNKEVSGIVIALLQLNVLADPLLYGLGMPDVRNGIFRELRKIKQAWKR